MDLQGIGRRVAYWRERRGLTQSDFAVLMDQSRRWVQAFEGGQRQADPRISIVEKAAEVLRIPIEALLSDTTSADADECVDQEEIRAIRDVLQRHDVITGHYPRTPADLDPDLAAIRRSVAYGWDAFQAAHYSGIGRVLPPLIIEAQQATGAVSGDQRAEAFGLLSRAYQLASSTLLKFGDATLGWHAADRAVTTAERSGDPLVIGGAARRLTDAMLHGGAQRPAMNLAVATAQRLEPDLAARTAAGLSVLGMLYLKAAVAAAENQDKANVTDLLDEAAGVAVRVGGDINAEWSAFGPTNCEVHRVSTMVQLGDGVAAAAAASGIDAAALALLPRERRAHHLVDVAQGLALARRRDEATTMLLEAEKLAPQEVHCRPRAVELVERLIALSVSSPSWQLRAMAQRCGLAV